MKLLGDLTEEEYWAEYNAALERCNKQNILCGCCNVMVMACSHWQNIRLILAPAPSERKLLDSR